MYHQQQNKWYSPKVFTCPFPSYILRGCILSLPISIENTLLFPGYIEGNDLCNVWGVPTLFGLEVGYCPTKDSYILWAALWEVSLNTRHICLPWVQDNK